MTEQEILDSLKHIEIRTGKERTIKSYVLRSSTLDEAQKQIVLSGFERYCALFRDELTDPKTLFKDPSKPVIVEIGFGMGTSTQIIAKERADYNYLCLEVYLVGFVKLLRDIEKLSLDNILLMRFNAVDVLSHMIADGTIRGFHIFFPDPWPKKKHHKRRIMQSDFISLLSSKLEKGGYIYFVTDWQEYADWTLELLEKEETLYNPYDGFAPHVSWRPETKFERKGLDKSYQINELWFKKK